MLSHTQVRTHSPVLDFEAIVQPSAEKRRLRGNFFYVHTVKVYVDAAAFFAEEFCQREK